MTRYSRSKGARGEREVVEILRGAGFTQARRTLAGDGRQPGDVSGGPAGWLLEVKYHADVAAAVRIGLVQADHARAAANMHSAAVAIRLPNMAAAWVAVMRAEYADPLWPVRPVADRGPTLAATLRAAYIRGRVVDVDGDRVAAPLTVWALRAWNVAQETAS